MSTAALTTLFGGGIGLGVAAVHALLDLRVPTR